MVNRTCCAAGLRWERGYSADRAMRSTLQPERLKVTMVESILCIHLPACVPNLVLLQYVQLPCCCMLCAACYAAAAALMPCNSLAWAFTAAAAVFFESISIQLFDPLCPMG